MTLETPAPVDSVNGMTGEVILGAGDIGIADLGGYYTGLEIESALQEIADGTTLDGRYLLLDASNSPITGALDISNTLSILGQNELRFYEGINYVGFEAPTLLSDQIWVLPDVDGGENDILVTDGAGSLSFKTLGSLGEGAGPTIADGSTLYWDAPTVSWIAMTSIFYDDAKDSIYIGDGGDTNFSEFSADGALIFRGEAGLAFGEIFIAKGNTNATTITLQNTWYQVTQFDNDGKSNNVTPDHTSDHILITNPGRYLVTLSACVKTAAAGLASMFEFQVYKNNGATAFSNLSTCRNMAGGGGDAGSISISGIIDIATNDTIELWVRNMTNTSNIVFESANLTITQVAGT